MKFWKKNDAISNDGMFISSFHNPKETTLSDIP